MDNKPDIISIYILSDSLGETAQYVARAATRQFPKTEFKYKHIPFVEDASYLTEVMKKIDPSNSVLFYTLVVPRMRDFIEDYCAESDIPCIDVLKRPFSVLEEVTTTPPLGTPGPMPQMDASYYRKVNAIEFAIKYDDGKDYNGLLQADLILIGVSRTSKTPLSMYLAYRGLKVANVPLVKQVKVSDKLFEIPRKKIVGLTIRPDVLYDIRTERMKDLGVHGKTDYTDLANILDELDYAEDIMKRVSCPVIDVSHKAIEETANTILQIYYGRGENVIE